jgi:hypothetical protein
MTDQGWLDLIQSHLERYPDAEPQDVLKLLWDAHVGPWASAHLPALSEEALRKRATDLDLSDVPEWEEPVEVLDPDLQLARVHLRPYLRAGGDLRRLARAIPRTAEQLAGRAERLGEVVARLRPLVRRLDLSDAAFDADALLDALSRVPWQRAPSAPRHSAAYEDAYRPAYCVVSLDAVATD